MIKFMKNTDPKTIDAMAAEIAAHEQAAAAKRAEMQAAQEAENARRHPLNLLLQTRLNLKNLIERNRVNIAAHAVDAAEFEKHLDNYFNTQSEPQHQGRAYSFAVPTFSYPFAMADAVVEKLTTRLVKAERELTEIETKIVTLAGELGLEELIPAELKK
jgi:hypothetical protein